MVELTDSFAECNYPKKKFDIPSGKKATEAEMVELAKQLEGKEIVLKAKTGVNDQLYGSITSADIADGLSSTAGITIDKKKIELEEHIRQLGSYEIAVRLFKDIAPRIKLAVVAEEMKGDKEKKSAKIGEAKKAKAKKIVEEVKGTAERKEKKSAKVVKAKKVKAEKPAEEAEKAEKEKPEEKEEAD